MKGLYIEKNKIAVVGFGISGKSVARYFLAKGLLVDVYEDKRQEDFDLVSIQEFTDQPDFQIYFAADHAIDATQYDYVVASPGVPKTHPVVARAREAMVECVTDITVFLRLFRAEYPKGRVVSITGSNGKSTTVSMLYAALVAAGTDVYLGGNIGMSPLDFFAEIQTDAPVIVLETSSYQLEYLSPEDTFDVAGITNISDNHLNRYQGKKHLYAEAKLGGIGSDTEVLLNLDDELSKSLVVPKIKSKHVLPVQFESGFSEPCISLEDNALVYKNAGQVQVLLADVRKLSVLGLHNVYNAAFACGVFVALEIALSPEVEQTMYAFEGLIHRVQSLGAIEGVLYVNDSKSTSPDATSKALGTLSGSKNTILISGGNDKDISYDAMRDGWQESVKGLVLLPGSANPKLKNLAERTGVELLGEVATMQDAVDVARTAARPGDTVLLSPATDSHASFKSFEDRGNQFIACVQSLRAV